MKPLRILHHPIHFKIGLLLALMLSFSIYFVHANDQDKKVMDAFELRLKGKTDQAKDLLLTIVKENPANAIAQFELARTLNYMNLRGSEEADKALKLAIENDPDNIVFAYYNSKNCFLKAYMAMHQGGDNTKDLVNNVCKEFIKVLEMKPDYTEALMYLVEIYGILPPEMGGDKIKAKTYAEKLEKLDIFYGAKARLVLMPQETDRIEYWKDYLTKNGESWQALKELGVAYIFSEDIEKAEETFKKIIEIDDAQNIRLLDLARFHQMKVMQNKDVAEKELPKAKKYIKQYLASMPEPIPALKAYAMGTLASIEMFSGNKEAGEKLMAEAKALDPYFSRAFGIPSMNTFEPPMEMDHHFVSFFSPF